MKKKNVRSKNLTHEEMLELGAESTQKTKVKPDLEE